MTHPLTPPPELVEQWITEFYGTVVAPGEATIDIATRAAQWGADQELEACIDWMSNAKNHGLGWDLARTLSDKLRAARRPKPPSLKEQAVIALQRIEDNTATYLDSSIIRRALEALPDD